MKVNLEGLPPILVIHFYDMLSWIFGEVQENVVHLRAKDKSSGYLEFNNARVRWFLSINEHDLPLHIQEKGQRTYRSITIDNEELEFSSGFTDLHTKSYEQILKGKGFGMEEAQKSIQIVHDIRNTSITNNGSFHPFCN